MNLSVGTGDGIIGFIYESGDFSQLKNFSDTVKSLWNQTVYHPAPTASIFSEEPPSRIGLIVGLTVFFILLISVGIIFILLRRYFFIYEMIGRRIGEKLPRKSAPPPSSIELSSRHESAKRTTRENFGNFVLNYKDLNFGDKLGVGAFGVVHK